MKFKTRRAVNSCLFAVLAGLAVFIDFVATSAMRQTAFVSGWSLLLLVIGLTLYNVRKKLPFLRLGSSALWLQFHLYGGLFAGVLFCIHLGWRLPTGIFEQVFSAIFVTVFFSGIFGVIISRVFARRLGARGNDVLFNRIPRMRHHLREQAEQLVAASMVATGSSAIPEFYGQRLKEFFERPRNLVQHLLLADRPFRKLMGELNSQQRYMNDAERETMRAIGEVVVQKNELDLQLAHQTVLKYWLFIHVPLSYAMLICIALHLVLIYSFVEVAR